MPSNIPFKSCQELLDFIEGLGLTYRVSALRAEFTGTHPYTAVWIEWSKVRLRFYTADSKSVSIRCFDSTGALLRNWGTFSLTEDGKKRILRQTEEFIRSLPASPKLPSKPRKKA